LAYEIVVTEVTLYGKLRCVAGFDRKARAMVRPEPEAAGFWPLITCGPGTVFHPGHVVRFKGVKPDTDPPHRTEDIVVQGKPFRADALDPAAFKTVLRESAFLTPAAVYGDHLVIDGQRAFVPAGSPCGSLACASAQAETLRFSDAVYDGQHRLRAAIFLDGRMVQLPVAAKDLKQAFLKNGAVAARDLVPRNGAVQVRLGLARPFAQIPDKCWCGRPLIPTV